MSNASVNSFLQALTSGLLKSNEAKVFKYIETVGPNTWQNVQKDFERITGKRMRDSVFSGAVSKLNKEGKLKIIREVLNEETGMMNSVYDVVR